jgi:hypothetical protein
MELELQKWQFNTGEGRFIIQRDPDGVFVMTVGGGIIDEDEILARGEWEELVERIVAQQSDFPPWDRLDSSVATSIAIQPSRWWRPQWTRAKSKRDGHPIWTLQRLEAPQAPPQSCW